MESETCFLPSPNWYRSRVIDCSSKDGLLAYGRANSVVLLRLPDEGNAATTPIRLVDIVPKLHDGDVTSVSFCRFFTDYPLLATSGSDGKLTVLNIASKQVIFRYDDIKVSAVAVAWTRKYDSTFYVVAGYESGEVVAANVFSRKVTIVSPADDKKSVTCVESCGNKPNLIAVGYASGDVAVLNAQRAFGVHCHLCGHKGPISSLTWAPSASVLDEMIERREDETDVEDVLLLASASRDNKIKLWSTQGRFVRDVLVPAKFCSIPHKKKQAGSSWLTLGWPDNAPNALTVGTYSGSVLKCDLLTNTWSILGGEDSTFRHAKAVFNLVCHGELTISTSLDRQVSSYHLHSRHYVCYGITRQNANDDVIRVRGTGVNQGLIIGFDGKAALWSVPTFSGHLYDLAFSPIDSCCMALAVGDGCIRTWNIDLPSSSATVHWQGIKGRVVAVAWHPNKESWLAYGTNEGEVGIVDVASRRPTMVSCTTHVKGGMRETVYVVTWGRRLSPDDSATPSSDGNEDFQLYSCGGGVIYVHDPQTMTKKLAQNFDSVLLSSNPSSKNAKSKRSDISWNDDLSLVAVGNFSGIVEIFTAPRLKLVATIPAFKKYIQCLRWHPKYSLSSVEPSLCRYLLAVSSLNSKVHVYDLKECFDSSSAEATAPIQILQPTYVLTGHDSGINSMSWNPHLEGQLATVSSDHTARIWNVLENKVISCYGGHKNRLYAACWSPLAPNVIFTGGQDFTLQKWNTDEHGTETVEKSICWNYAVTDTNDTNLGSSVSSDNKMIDSSDSTRVLESHCASFPDATIEMDSKTKKKLDSRKTTKRKTAPKTKSLFPLSSNLENRGKNFGLSDCVLLSENMTSAGDTPRVLPKDYDNVHLKIYSGRADAYQLLKIEADNHNATGNVDCALQLEIWKGNVTGALQMACEKEQLTDWLVSMAASVSQDFHAKICACYAQQLISTGNVHKAVLYLLNADKIIEAVEALRDHASYKEAVLLAKVRLPGSHPLVHRLVQEWTDKLIEDGNTEVAAKCFLSMGHSEKAVAVLCQKREPRATYVAARISTLCGCPGEQVDHIALQCISECICAADYEMAEKVLADFPSMKPFSAVLLLLRPLTEATTEADPILPLDDVKSAISNQCKLDDEELRKFYTRVASFPVLCPSTSFEIYAWMAVRLTLALVKVVSSEMEEARILLLSCLRKSYQAGTSYLRMLAKAISPAYLDLLAFGNGECEAGMAKSDTVAKIQNYLSYVKLQELLSEAKGASVENEPRLSCDCPKQSGTVDELMRHLSRDDDAEIHGLKTRLNYTKLALASRIACRKSTLPTVSQEKLVDPETDDGIERQLNGYANELGLRENDHIPDIDPVRFCSIFADELIENPEVNEQNLKSEIERIETRLREMFVTDSDVTSFPSPVDLAGTIIEFCTIKATCCGHLWEDLANRTLSFAVKWNVLRREEKQLANLERTFAISVKALR